MTWQSTAKARSRSYICAYCGHKVASEQAYFSNEGQVLYICPHCESPTYFDRNHNQIPDVAPGNDVQHVPKELAQLYRESRFSVSVGSYTASVLASRKMLMNIAVSQGAKEGESFLSYVTYLADTGFIPPNGKTWVDHIRTKGNEATHEIALMKKEDASELIQFIEMLLKFIYEFPNKVPKKT